MTDERDDEILGRALARAIEAQDAAETPYDRSRLAVRPLRRGPPVWRFAAVAAALVLAAGIGTWLTRPAANEPVSGPASASPTAPPASSPAVAATSGPQVEVPGRVWAYFTREAMPPIGAYVTAHGSGASPDGAIGVRLGALFSAPRSETPPGTTNPVSQAMPVIGGRSASFDVAVSVTGDLATLDFSAPDGWAIRDPYVRQFVQQVVYTATEEPGIRRVLMRERGKAVLKIDQTVIDRPLTRDDVSGYAVRAETGSTTFGGDDKTQFLTGDLVSREIVDGSSVRLTFVGSDRAHNAAKADLPPFTISFRQNDGTVPHNRGDGAPPAYLLAVSFKFNGSGEMGAVGHVERVDRSPLRLMTSTDLSYELGLDDARPWRAYMPDAQHLVVEIGGDPRAVSDRIALTAPAPDTTIDTRIARTFTLSGSARTFEANVVWRIRDGGRKVVASGHTTASLGTSALWGTFSTQITLPVGVSGPATLEVYEVSPKDGSEQGLVAVPHTIR